MGRVTMRSVLVAALVVALVLALPSIDAGKEPRPKPTHTTTPSPTPTRTTTTEGQRPTTTTPTSTPTPTPSPTPTPTPTPSASSTPTSATSASASPSTTTPTTTTTSSAAPTPSDTNASTQPSLTQPTDEEAEPYDLDVPFLAGEAEASGADFATIDLPAYPVLRDEPLAINATIHLNPLRLPATKHLMVLVTTHSDHLSVAMGDPRRLDGTLLPIQEDDRRTDEEKLFLDHESLDETQGRFVVPLTLEAHIDGRFHTGVFVLGFDDDWNAFEIMPGVRAEAFSPAAVSSVGHGGAVMGAPFAGDGNLPDLPASAAGCVLLLAAAWRRWG